MRLLCLHFPRLEVEIALRQSPHLAGRSVALLSQPGSSGHLTAVSAQAAERGLLTGMSAGEARRKDPTCVFLPNNTGAALDEIERIASIIRLRATPLVEIGGPSHLFVDLASVSRRYVDEPAIAARLRDLARAWSGLPVRAGAASTRGLALAGAMAARFQPSIDNNPGPATPEPPIAPFAERELTVTVSLPGEASPAEVRHRVGRALERLQTLLDARNEAFRVLHVENGCGGRAAGSATQRYANPVSEAATALTHAESHLCLAQPSPPHTIRVTLGRLCPDAGPRPRSSRPTGSVPVSAPSAAPRPRFQQMLLRATG